MVSMPRQHATSVCHVSMPRQHVCLPPKRGVKCKPLAMQKLKEWEGEVASCELLLYSGDMRAWNEVRGLWPPRGIRQLAVVVLELV